MKECENVGMRERKREKERVRERGRKIRARKWLQSDNNFEVSPSKKVKKKAM